MSFFGVLALIFITLKLIEVITWPWVWVLAPVWVGGAIALAAVATLIICHVWS